MEKNTVFLQQVSEGFVASSGIDYTLLVGICLLLLAGLVCGVIIDHNSDNSPF